MKYIGLSTTLLLFLLSSCSGQPRSEQTKSLDSIAPKTDIVVNRQFDENGNLIRYDSTYTQFYNSIEQDSLLADSILSEFKNRFNLQYPFSDRSYFNDFFFQDSLLQYDFYKKNFFYERFQNNMKRMDSLFQEMDSMKNRFFMDQFPQNK
ncbi:hypothetical protein [uncultured Sunxiuqinia sp.]|uniref:hypothetical protein n=1 Tax=uncultured Sunxiuqinia sp. TaxID=1573825 RepID=UPI0026168BAF|nr:hypothetical protein [uncultured Sunxiuqinia sp.]